MTLFLTLLLSAISLVSDSLSQAPAATPAPAAATSGDLRPMAGDSSVAVNDLAANGLVFVVRADGSVVATTASRPAIPPMSATRQARRDTGPTVLTAGRAGA